MKDAGLPLISVLFVGVGASFRMRSAPPPPLSALASLSADDAIVAPESWNVTLQMAGGDVAAKAVIRVIQRFRRDLAEEGEIAWSSPIYVSQ